MIKTDAVVSAGHKHLGSNAFQISPSGRKYALIVNASKKSLFVV